MTPFPTIPLVALQAASHPLDPFRSLLKNTLPYWRQLPLLTALAWARRDWHKEWHIIEVNHHWPLFKESTRAIWLNCATASFSTRSFGTPLMREDAVLDLVTSSAPLHGESFDASRWHGEHVARRLLAALDSPVKDYPDLDSHRRDQLHWISTHSLALTTPHPHASPALRATNEVFTSLAASWHLSALELVSTAVRTVGSQDDPEVSSLLVVQAALA